MNRILIGIWIGMMIFLFTGCVTNTFVSVGAGMTVQQGPTPDWDREQPGIILIMPPVNNTVDVDAKELFYTTLTQPLCDKGFYVISPFLAMEVLKNESGYDAEHFIESDLALFREYFGADGVLFTVIDNWNKSALTGEVSVRISYILRSAQTNETLYQNQAQVVLDTAIQTYEAGDNLWFAVFDVVATSINTAMSKKIKAAYTCNEAVLKDFPKGHYAFPVVSDKESSVAASEETVSEEVVSEEAVSEP